jgi:hypothetical protein
MYKYDDIGHQMISIRKEPVPLARALAGTDLEPSCLDFALIMTGAVERLRQKYENFSLRLAHLDAGCAAVQLVALATAYGLTVSFASWWDHGLPDLLELNPELELVTAVAGICLQNSSAATDGGSRWA